MTTPTIPTPATPSTPTPSTPTPLIRQPSSGLFTTSDFESKTHEQLLAMIEHTDAQGTLHLGAKLKVAATAIKKLGEDLKTHMVKVEWEGQGGDAFREWGADMANAALRLGEFSHSAGAWMAEAAETLTLVKSSMPDVSTESKTLLDTFRSSNPGQVGAVAPPGLSAQGGGVSPGASGPSQAQAYAAQQQLDADRAEAARLMRKLAESYSWSAHQISAAERPTFRPMPGQIVGHDPILDSEYIPRPGGGQQGSQGEARGPAVGAATSSVPQAPRADRYDAALPRVSGRQVEATLPEHRGVALPAQSTTGTVIDGTTSLPTAPSTLPVSHMDGQTGGRMVDGSSSVPGLVVSPSVSTGGSTGGGRVSPPTRPAMPTGRGMGVARPGLAVPRVSDPGIVGGRVVPPGQEGPVGQAPGGTVIGAEGQGQAQGRVPMGAGPAFGGPAGSVGRGSGMATGRRLATEPGGVIGGAPVRRPGATGEFTPGGSGLVRSRPAMDSNSSARGGPRGHGFPVPGSTGGTPSRRGNGGRRPDYLVEDEETWVQGTRRTVPPVVE